MLAFLDEAVVWMVARGQSEQWGAEPWSAQPKRVARVRAMAESGLLWMAESDGAPAGALVLGDPPEPIPPVDEPEVYIRFLITSRRLAGRGIGSDLIDFARSHTRAAGIKLLRVDCWAGAEGRLVDYYVRNGFTPTDKFSVDDWQGQVLEQRLD